PLLRRRRGALPRRGPRRARAPRPGGAGSAGGHPPALGGAPTPRSAAEGDGGRRPAPGGARGARPGAGGRRRGGPPLRHPAYGLRRLFHRPLLGGPRPPLLHDRGPDDPWRRPDRVPALGDGWSIGDIGGEGRPALAARP